MTVDDRDDAIEAAVQSGVVRAERLLTLARELQVETRACMRAFAKVQGALYKLRRAEDDAKGGQS
jgi:hypothetical protein